MSAASIEQLAALHLWQGGVLVWTQGESGWAGTCVHSTLRLVKISQQVVSCVAWVIYEEILLAFD